MKSFNIAGIQTYVYGLEQASGFSSVNVLYLLHGRLQNYKVTEAVALKVLENYYARDDAVRGLIAVTFDMPNHGLREVRSESNLDITEGNEHHIPDMVSIIDMAVEETLVVMRYLPFYLPFAAYSNIVSGISMGGHVVYRLSVRPEARLEGLAPIIASSDLTSLLWGRVRNSVKHLQARGEFPGAEIPEKALLKLYELSYEEALEAAVGSAAPQLRERVFLWLPQGLHTWLAQTDRAVAEKLPDIPILSLHGAEDPLVPPQHCRTLLDEWEAQQPSRDYVCDEQSGTGHACTPEMVEKLSEWMARWRK